MTETVVVDNSVVISWCFKDETNQYADSVLDKLLDKRIRDAAKDVSVAIFEH